MSSSSAKPPAHPLSSASASSEAFTSSSELRSSNRSAYGSIRTSSSHPDLHLIAADAAASRSSPDIAPPTYTTLTPSYSTSSLVNAANVNRDARATVSSSSLMPSPSLQAAAPSPNRANPHHIAASTSFFGLPLSLSMLSIRSPSTYSNLNQAARQEEIDWHSLYVVYIITLVAESARGLMLPSTWPYYASLGGLKSSLGFFVASFSLGRMFSTIPLGYLSDSYSISAVLIVASVLQIVGHVVYAVAPSLYVLFAARLLVGLGSATMAVCRAHLTRAVPLRQRTPHFAYLSGLQFVGFAVLPGIGGLMNLLPHVEISSHVKLNGFTYPAYFLVLANAFCVYLVFQYYSNPPPVQPRIPSIRSASLQRLNALAEQHQQNRPDVFALVTCLLLNIVYRGVIAEFETISVPFLMEHYDITFEIASYFLSVIGFVGLFVYMCFKPISLRFSDRLLVIIGLCFIIAGCAPLSIPAVSMHLPLIVYVFLLGLTWSIAYPIGQTAVLAVFSKILYGLPAGGLLGIFSASGSVARIFMAVLASQIWKHAGRESAYAVMVAYTLVALVLATVSYSRLKPRSPLLHLLTTPHRS